VSLLRALKRDFGFYCIEPVAEEMDDSFVVVGGLASNHEALSRMDHFHVLSGAWENAAPMKVARCDFGYCELAGELFVIGGLDSADVMLASVERYSLTLDTWRSAPAMPRTRKRHCACAVGKIMYVMGGVELWEENGDSDYDNGYSRMVEVYSRDVLMFDSLTQIWSEVDPMPEGRYAAAACVLGSDIYIHGGKDEVDNLSSTTFCYRTETNEWSTLAPLPEDKAAHSACVLDGLIYITGGYSIREAGVHWSVYHFDPVANSWSRAACIMSARSCHTSFVLGGSLYVAGGWDGARRLASVERYCSASDRWSEVTDMAMGQTRTNFGAIAVNGARENMDLLDGLIAKAERARR
jgi:hypothetical protein